jgi:hypothetical protein
MLDRGASLQFLRTLVAELPVKALGGRQEA